MYPQNSHILLGLLVRVWPADKVLLGMRVCKLLRQELPSNAKQVLLVASYADDGYAPTYISSRLAAFVSCESSLVCRGFPRSFATLRRALRSAVEDGFGAKLVYLDLAGNHFFPEFALEAIGYLLEHSPDLHHLDLSMNPLRDFGAGVLSAAMRNCPALTHVDLSQTCLGAEGIMQLAGGLGRCTELKRLSLSSNAIDGVDAWQNLADALRGCTKLEQLDLHSNPIRAEGARLLAEVLTSRFSALAKLDLSSCELGAAGIASLQEVLSLSSLLSLKLHANDMTGTGANAFVGTCTALTFLDISCNLLEMGQFTPWLTVCLRQCKQLAHLDLSGNWIAARGGEVLAKAILAYPTTLRQLRVSANGMGLASSPAVVKSLSARCPRITVLEIGSNMVGDIGIRGMETALRSLKELASLDLSDNEIGAAGMAYLAKCSLEALTSLNLSQNSIGDDGAERLGELLACCRGIRVLNLTRCTLRLQGAVALAPALGTCRQLKRLELSMNRVGSKGAGAIGAAVAACPMLRAVDMSQNFLQDEGILNLAELLAAQGRPTSGALERLDVSHNDAGAEANRRIVQALPRCMVVVG
mmetsp:Transcript_55568/g.84104  ORF Transcript_55568/g.84104 Transcript_55568/m.84104 type:complete len:585 (-) Transcript_55568:192-1946(-)